MAKGNATGIIFALYIVSALCYQEIQKEGNSFSSSSNPSEGSQSLKHRDQREHVTSTESFDAFPEKEKEKEKKLKSDHNVLETLKFVLKLVKDEVNESYLKNFKLNNENSKVKSNIKISPSPTIERKIGDNHQTTLNEKMNKIKAYKTFYSKLYPDEQMFYTSKSEEIVEKNLNKDENIISNENNDHLTFQKSISTKEKGNPSVEHKGSFYIVDKKSSYHEALQENNPNSVINEIVIETPPNAVLSKIKASPEAINPVSSNTIYEESLKTISNAKNFDQIALKSTEDGNNSLNKEVIDQELDLPLTKYNNAFNLDIAKKQLPKQDQEPAIKVTENAEKSDVVNFVELPLSKELYSESGEETKTVEGVNSKVSSESIYPEKEVFEHVLLPLETLQIDKNLPELVDTFLIESNKSEEVISEEEEIEDELKKNEEKDQLETYSQFAQRVNAEQKNGGGSNGLVGNGQSNKGPKIKSKNYASPDCGAKLIAANQESSHSHKIIHSNRDEYMLNKCTEKIWAIVELCESIRPQKFDIANFELFSNSPKDIHLFGGHRYPTREWTSLGVYEGEEGNREVQSFPIENLEFFKYIKVEVLSHYGIEFFCPLSLFRIYGLSEFEVIDQLEETEETEEEQDELIEEVKFDKNSSKEKPGMIPHVIKSMLRGVLEVIKRGSRPESNNNEPEDFNAYTQSCRSLHSNFSIKNEFCSASELLNYILACYYDEYKKLMSRQFFLTTVNDNFCRNLANIVCSPTNKSDSYIYDSVCFNSYVCVMLSPKHILAICHMHNPSILNDLKGCEINDTHPPENYTSFDNSTLEMQSKLEMNVQNDKVNITIVEASFEVDNEEKFENVENLEENDLQTPVPSLEDGDYVLEIPQSESKPANKVSKFLQEKENETTEKQSVLNATHVILEKGKKTGNETLENKKEKKLDKGFLENLSTTPTDDSNIQLQSINAPTTTVPLVPSSESRAHTTTNKESVVVRLSNKIKVLEHNMSISSQYLEELSRRYKRQMEEMQRQFNVTILALNSTSETAFDRDLIHQQQIETLKEKLDELAETVNQLVKEKESLLTHVIEQHIVMLFLEIIIMCSVFTWCVKKRKDNTVKNPSIPFIHANSNVKSDSPGNESSSCNTVNLEYHCGRDAPLIRRRSIDSINQDYDSKPKQRRFSAETLIKSGTYKDLLIREDHIGGEKKHQKKNGKLKRSISNSFLIENAQYLSAPSKKDKRIEKMKKSSAGVLFSAENKIVGSLLTQSNQRHMVEMVKSKRRSSEKFCNDLNEAWSCVRNGKVSKVKKDIVLEESLYLVSNDFKTGKSLYSKDYFTHIPYDENSQLYGKEYVDADYELNPYECFDEDVGPICESINNIYTSSLDYNAPVINDYYNSLQEAIYPVLTEEKLQPELRSEPVISPFWPPSALSKSFTKVSALSEFPENPSTNLKKKTKLRSDNWEWYSNQPSKSDPSLPIIVTTASEVVSTTSSGDSSSKLKQDVLFQPDKNDVIKLEKKKRKKKQNKNSKI